MKSKEDAAAPGFDGSPARLFRMKNPSMRLFHLHWLKAKMGKAKKAG